MTRKQKIIPLPHLPSNRANNFISSAVCSYHLQKRIIHLIRPLIPNFPDENFKLPPPPYYFTPFHSPDTFLHINS